MVGILGLALAGCGTAAASGPPASTSSTAAESSATAVATVTSPVKTAQVTVNGKLTTVLTNSAGQTLYWFSADTATSTHCTGSCALIWPALLTGGSTVATPSGLSGHLSVVVDQLGHQVAYNGHLLYTYAADTAPGQAKGEGLKLNGGVWWVATPGLPVLTASGGAAASSSSSAGSSSGSGWGG